MYFLTNYTALRVCKAFITSPAVESRTNNDYARPFVYVSAEDIFRPVIPARYIETKREAEQGIEEMIEQTGSRYRGVYIRPSAWLSLLVFSRSSRALCKNTTDLSPSRFNIPCSPSPSDNTGCSVARSLGFDSFKGASRHPYTVQRPAFTRVGREVRCRRRHWRYCAAIS